MAGRAKKGASLATSASREAAARTGAPSRLSTVRMLSVEQAVRASAGHGYSAKQKRRLGIS